MVGYTGNSWYVSPVINNKYPPDKPPDPVTPVVPINFGLFYMCYRSHCKYDLRQDYQIVLLLPKEYGKSDLPWEMRTNSFCCTFTVNLFVK